MGGKQGNVFSIWDIYVNITITKILSEWFQGAKKIETKQIYFVKNQKQKKKQKKFIIVYSFISRLF